MNRVRAPGYPVGMSVTRHFSDTRTDEGRVRVLVRAGQVVVEAEGPGWRHHSVHPDLADATLELAWLPALSARLYGEVMREIERQLLLNRASGGFGDTDLPGAA